MQCSWAKSRCDVAAYLTMRIENGKLKYSAVIKRYAKYKDDIDLTLEADGYEIINDVAVKKEV